MANNRVFLVLEIILLMVVSASLGGCGGGHFSSQATPDPTTSHLLDTGPLGLPLYCPEYLAHDQQGNIYVTDTDEGNQGSHRARVVKLSPAGQLLSEWHVFNTYQSQPSSLGAIIGPFGLAVDAQGTIYVADGGDNTIKKLSPTGQLLATWGKTGSAPGELSWPQGVAVDAQGNVYVTDLNNSRIEKFSSTGTLLGVFGNTGSSHERLNVPAGIDVDAQGNLYVADLRNHRVAKFSPSGTFLTAWTEANGTQLSSARGVAVDSAGNIYIADARNFRLVKFSPTGDVLAIWPLPTNLFQFGLTVDSQGNIYVAETPTPNSSGVKGGILKLSPSGTVLDTWPASC